MITAIICAAGSGTRTGFPENKILHNLNGMPVLCYSLSAFSCAEVGEILVACREEDRARVALLLSPYPNARTVLGGKTRTQTILRALLEARGEIVLVHDAARPFVSQGAIQRCIESVRRCGSGVCAVPVTETVALTEEGQIAATPARQTVFSVQTPQGFYRDKLLSAYRKMLDEGREEDFTDDSGVYAAYLSPPHVCEGERGNKKLTYPEDFLPAERVGFGTDTHAFGAPQPYLTLAGVRIPSKSGLIAHSDGDVLAHAVMDALLSAAGLRDIGHYFPDTDERYRGADSMRLLAEVVGFVRGEGFVPQNVSVSVLAETPRLSPYIERMKENIAHTLSLSPSAVGVAAGTNERLGYVGEGKGITVYATVLLRPLSQE